MSDHLDSPGPVVLPASATADAGPNEGLDALFPDNRAGVDAVSIGPPHGLDHLATDITDVYAFAKPDASREGEGEGEGESDDEAPGKSILVLNVNPLALAKKFESDAEYLIRVDTDGDHVEDITFSFAFSSDDDGGQAATVRRIDAKGSKLLIRRAPVSFGSEAHITHRGAYRFFAGLRSDPFFFDLLGFIDDLNFVNGDFFADKNVFAIVLEVPNSALGKTPATTALWGRTRIKNPAGEGMINDDIAARAAINTVFNHGQDKNVFNDLEPSQQTTTLNGEGITFLQSFTNTVNALTSDSGYAAAIAAALLPDVLNYDYTKPADYSKLNGRRLHDPVIGISLSLITKNALTTDHVDPHTDYLDHFPYVGKPH